MNTPFVSVSNVTKVFDTGKEQVDALRNVSFDVMPGEFISLLGPSGCGKSTMLNLCAGLDALTSGTIRVLGKSVNGPVTEIGMVFQSDHLLPWRSALDNVLIQSEFRGLPRRASRVRAEDLLQQVGLGDSMRKLPSELSGGMKQRVAIARSLLHDPPLIFMDEPFAALDAITRDEMTLELRRLVTEQSKTVVFVTHSIDEAVFLSDKIFVMSPRPGTIEKAVDVELPRDRSLAIRDEMSFRSYASDIRSTFEKMGLFGHAQ